MIWLLLGCAWALRVQPMSRRTLWQQAALQEGLSVLLHTCDLARSRVALARLLQSPAHPFQVAYDSGCRGHMTNRRFVEVLELPVWNRSGFLELFAAPDCLAEARQPFETGLLGYSQHPLSMLLSAQASRHQLSPVEVLLEGTKLLTLPVALLTSCHWSASIGSAVDQFTKVQQLEFWNRLHPLCLDEALGSNEAAYISGLSDLMGNQVARHRLGRHGPPCSREALARSVVKWCLLYRIATETASGGGKGAAAGLRKKLKYKLAQLLQGLAVLLTAQAEHDGQERAMQELHTRHARGERADGKGWAGDLLRLLAAVLNAKAGPIPRLQDLLDWCAADLGSVWQAHWALLVVWLHSWTVDGMSEEAQRVFEGSLGGRDIWPLDAALALQLAHKYRPGGGAPPKALLELISGTRAERVQRSIVLDACAKLGKRQTHRRTQLGAYERALLGAVPVARRLRLLRERYAGSWPSLGPRSPTPLAWKLACQATRQYTEEPGPRHGQAVSVMHGVVHALFDQLREDCVVMPGLEEHVIQWQEKPAVQRLASMLALAVLYDVRLPGRLAASQLGVIAGYQDPVLVASVEPSRPARVILGFGEGPAVRRRLFATESRELAHMALLEVLSAVRTELHALVPGLRILSLDELVGVLNPK